MSYRKNYRKGKEGKFERDSCSVKDKKPEECQDLSNVDESRANCLHTFKGYQTELDNRYDLVERLIKKSRDVTIESKRIIFLLHRKTNGDEGVLEEAHRRITDLREKNFRAIAEELVGQDKYAFLHYYSPGLEEYIEALSYYYYLKDGSLISWKLIQDQLKFMQTEESSGETSSSLTLYFPPTTYVLGVADLTGELMRKCINDVGAGDVESPFKLRPFIRDILDCFVHIGNGPRELNNKLKVMYQNVAKVDNACYAIRVRRNEIPDYKPTDMTFMSHNLEHAEESFEIAI
ncbi:hypothetical protein CHUAL_003332 [Chamberlinius hualienensis]